MYRRILFMVGSIVLLSVSAVQSQNYYAYKESGETVNLTVQDTIITAKLVDAPQFFWTSVYASDSALNEDIPPEPLCDGFYRLRVIPGNDPEALVERLREREEIYLANVSFLDPKNNPIYTTETFVANFNVGVTSVQIDSMNAAHSVEIVDTLFGDPYWLVLRVTQNSDLDVLSMGNAYHESPLVQFARAAMVLNFEFYGTPNDEYWQYQWYFQNTGQSGGTPNADIDLDEAFDYTLSPSAYVTIAILDDGFAAHEDFPSERFAGGYGYVYHIGPDFSPWPYAAHGMGTMGIIAATNNNSLGVAGISNNFRIIAQRIGNHWNGALTATDVNVARAFSDAVLAGARVISNSWGCRDCDTLSDSTTYWIRKSDSAGAVVVFSSGNYPLWYPTKPVAFPARLPEVLAVGATDSNDARWIYSNYGERLDVVAPSSEIALQGDIWTLDQMGSLGYNPKGIACSPSTIDYDCKFGGTSAACPQVAGVVGLVLRKRPDLVGNTQQLKDIIRYSAEDKGAPGWDQYYGWGRLNAARALLAVSRGEAITVAQ